MSKPHRSRYHWRRRRKHKKNSNKKTPNSCIKLRTDTNTTGHHTSTSKHKPSNYMERSSRAVDINVNTFAFGKFELEIIGTDLVKPWKNAYKIMRKTGIMIIKVQHNHNINGSPSIIRTTLVRKSNIHRHHLTNEICLKHNIKEPDDADHKSLKLLVWY